MKTLDMINTANNKQNYDVTKLRTPKNRHKSYCLFFYYYYFLMLVQNNNETNSTGN